MRRKSNTYVTVPKPLNQRYFVAFVLQIYRTIDDIQLESVEVQLQLADIPPEGNNQQVQGQDTNEPRTTASGREFVCGTGAGTGGGTGGAGGSGGGGGGGKKGT